MITFQKLKMLTYSIELCRHVPFVASFVIAHLIKAEMKLYLLLWQSDIEIESIYGHLEACRAAQI